MSDNEIPTQEDSDAEGHRMSPYAVTGDDTDTDTDTEGDDAEGHRMSPYAVRGENNDTQHVSSQPI